MVNAADDCPASTVTLGGTLATVGRSLFSVTTTPPEGAGPDNVTVPIELVPLPTVEGFNVSDAGLGGGGGVTVSTVVFVAPSYEAVMVAAVDAATDDVPIANVADVDPAAIVTLAGTPATEESELLSVTVTPSLGAAPLSVTVPVDDWPPTTLEGFALTP